MLYSKSSLDKLCLKAVNVGFVVILMNPNALKKNVSAV